MIDNDEIVREIDEHLTSTDWVMRRVVGQAKGETSIHYVHPSHGNLRVDSYYRIGRLHLAHYPNAKRPAHHFESFAAFIEHLANYRNI